jgi:hypothetical protein
MAREMTRDETRTFLLEGTRTGELLVRIAPTHVVAQAAVAD